jgi:hypothetical protein
MELRILYRGAWLVAAPMDGTGHCALEEELVRCMADPKLRGYVVGLRALWERIPRTGPRALGPVLYHCVDEEHKIYEFIKGPLRLLCFEAKGAIVVCAHLLRKKTQKMARRDKIHAVALRERFLAARAAGDIQLIDDEAN